MVWRLSSYDLTSHDYCDMWNANLGLIIWNLTHLKMNYQVFRVKALDQSDNDPSNQKFVERYLSILIILIQNFEYVVILPSSPL